MYVNKYKSNDEIIVNMKFYDSRSYYNLINDSTPKLLFKKIFIFANNFDLNDMVLLQHRILTKAKDFVNMEDSKNVLYLQLYSSVASAQIEVI